MEFAKDEILEFYTGWLLVKNTEKSAKIFPGSIVKIDKSELKIISKKIGRNRTAFTVLECS